MDGLSLERWVEAIHAGDWTLAGIDPPRLALWDYETIVRQALREHQVDPLTSRPSELVKAEGFKLYNATLPRRCGATRGRDLFVPRWNPPERTRLLIHHERSHGWIVKRGDTEANEADAWVLTAYFAWPWWLSHREPPPLEPWFLRLCVKLHNKSYRGFLTGT